MKERADKEATPPLRRRRPEVLVAPLVTLVAVVAGLLALRLGAPLPWRPGPCGFKATFDRPCPACGGTRAARALARGEWAKAVRSNPAVPAGAAGAFLWLGLRWCRYLAGTPPLGERRERRRLLLACTAGVLLLFANWIYLLCVL